jgi:hypothetical protein
MDFRERTLASREREPSRRPVSGGIHDFSPTAPLPPTEVQLRFDCANSPPAPTVTGVNTLLLSASTAPVADVVAIAVGSPPGSVVVDAGHQGAFAVTAVNLGASDTLTVSVDTGAVSLPLDLTLCQTTIATAACLNPPVPSVTIPMAAGTGTGLAVFVTATGRVRSDAATNRIFVRFKDGKGVIRGSTSVAVQAD